MKPCTDWTEEKLLASVKASEGFIKVRYSSVPGTFVTEYCNPAIPLPVGTVWWRWGCSSGTIEVLNSFVLEFCRRLGVRTRIHEWMIKKYEGCSSIVTYTGNEMSEPWLKKNKFKLSKEDQIWKLKIKR